MSSGARSTVSNAAGAACISASSVGVPATGEAAAGSFVITTKCSHESTSPNAACPICAIGSSAVPSKQR